MKIVKSSNWEEKKENQLLTARNSFVCPIGTIVDIVAEFGSIDTLGTTSDRSLRAEEPVL